MVEIRDNVCGGVAFLYEETPQFGDLPNPGKARLLDGSTPLAAEPMVCGTCGRNILNLADLTWSS